VEARPSPRKQPWATAEITTMVNIVGKYVDGLEVSVSGRFRTPVFEWLKAEKRALRASAHNCRDIGPVPGVLRSPLMLTGKGGGSYYFILEHAAIERLVLTTWERTPEIVIRFRTKTLHEHDLREIEAFVDKVAAYFLEDDFKVLVSRFDVAVDVQLPGGKMPARQDIITRLKGRTFDESPERITGMKFGSDKGPLQIELYNKTRELKVHRNKGWIKADWATSETYDEGLDVQRIEFRFFREFLHQFKREDPMTGQVCGIDSISDLISSTEDLFRYVLGRDGGKGSQFRIASPDSRGLKRYRRRSSPWWEKICRELLKDTLQAGRIRTHTPSSSPSLESALSTAVTWMVLAAAWECVLHDHPPKPAEEYLGPSLLPILPKRLKRDGHGSWEEAVAFKANRLISTGQAP
jgi:hypothetical protein